ncbi:MAG TPA: hypothetical protein PKO06_03470 [Candidatus Ozemobacteraceae bacterium]|nr:hypothetical protein [Candidatus Ozemobacteraceae bacterium]
MPHRHVEIWLGIVGLFAALVVLACGRNVQQEAERGRGHLGRLLRAALALIGLLGLSGSAEAATAAKPANLIETYRETLGRSVSGKHLLETWQAAREIADGTRGAYPFDAAGKKAFLAELARALADVDALVKDRVFQLGEASLLKLELRELTAGVQRRRTTESQNVTCYRVATVSPVRVSRRRLEARIPLVEKLLPGRVSPLVQETVIKGCAADLAYLQQQADEKRLPADERAPVEDLIRRARPALERLQVSVQAQDVKGYSRDVWEKIFAAWEQLQKMVDGGSTTKEREDMGQTLGEIDELLKQQREERRLAYEESESVSQELRFLFEKAREMPPKDSTITCYKMAYVPPAKMSLERLEKRLPLLKRVKAKGQLPKTTLLKMMKAIEVDLTTTEGGVDDPDLSADEREQARRISEQIRLECERLYDVEDRGKK